MFGFIRTAQLVLIAGTVLGAPFAAGAADSAQDEQVAFATPVTDMELSQSRGAFLPSPVNVANVSQTATDGQNIVIGGTTGTNMIGDGAFTNSQGLVNVIQNSGNNVVIQSSTVVNMSISK